MSDDLPPSPILKLSRRQLLHGAPIAAGSLVLGVTLPGLPALAAPPSFKPTLVTINAWLRLSSREIVVAVPQAEMGQGIMTSLALLVAEELECDWTMVAAELVAPDPAYLNPVLGQVATGESSSLRTTFLPLRRAGAAARLMLTAAAARLWRVPVAECLARAGTVSHPASGRTAGYGALAASAARQPVPEPGAIVLKERARWSLIGHSVPRLDVPAKVDGSAPFALDLALPGLVSAAIRHAPQFGATVTGINDSVARSWPGVIAVVALADAVAVVAQRWHQAQRALKEVTVSWSAPPPELVADDAAALARLRAGLAERNPVITAERGAVEVALKGAERVIAAEYRLPFLAHAPLEPTNATARVTPERCEVWLPTQAPGPLQALLAERLGLKPAQVLVHPTLVGGSFGRRREADAALEAALISRQVGGRPVRLMWSREEDFRHDYYRPAAVVGIQVALDHERRIAAWRQRVVAPSVLARTAPEKVRDGGEPLVTAGIADQPYLIPALRVEYVRCNLGVPVGYWRSDGHSINAFAVECMIDEVAAALHQDPLHLRRNLLAQDSRAMRVLNRAASLIGWGTALPAASPTSRRGRGLACHSTAGTLVAVAAEVTLGDDGVLAVDRLIAVADCGTVVHPDAVEGQLRGGLIFALGATLEQKISLQDGQVTAAGFDDFPLPRLGRLPEITIEVVPSEAGQGGIGEVAVPPLAPAIVNAVSSALGRRVRVLPLSEADLSRSAG